MVPDRALPREAGAPHALFGTLPSRPVGTGAPLLPAVRPLPASLVLVVLERRHACGPLEPLHAREQVLVRARPRPAARLDSPGREAVLVRRSSAGVARRGARPVPPAFVWGRSLLLGRQPPHPGASAVPALRPGPVPSIRLVSPGGTACRAWRGAAPPGPTAVEPTPGGAIRRIGVRPFSSVLERVWLIGSPMGRGPRPY